MAISAACSICPLVPPSAAAESAGGHGAGYADFALAADLRAADGGVLFIEDADGGGGEEEAQDAGLRHLRRE
jgi:hypothetical protein